MLIIFDRYMLIENLAFCFHLTINHISLRCVDEMLESVKKLKDKILL